MKKTLIKLLFMLSLSATIISEELPYPKNGQLYTEFTSYKSARYLKKPLIGSGYIAFNNGKFIFRQIKPVLISIIKKEDKIYFRKGGFEPVIIDPSDENYSVMIFIFTDPEKIKEKFSIKKEEKENESIYKIIPKTRSKILSIRVISLGDKVSSLELEFSDGSELTYKFKNTVTGIKPDEKLYE